MNGLDRKRKRLDTTTRTVLLIAAAALVLVVVVALLAPGAEDDPTPSTWNTGKAGTKAALLLLTSLGYDAHSSEAVLDGPESPIARLAPAEARQTTLILADPEIPHTGLKDGQAAVAGFLAKGGSVLATGVGGAVLLDRSEIRPSARLLQGLCNTTPEGASPLARAGTVPIAAAFTWADPTSEVDLPVLMPGKNQQPAAELENFYVAQRCGREAVVVRWQAGAGTATWWSSAMPLTNGGLHDEASLRLLLASLWSDGASQAATQGGRAGQGAAESKAPKAGRPAGRRVLFDESLHGFVRAQQGDPLAGLPLPLLWSQAGLVLGLLLFSFSRRQGAVRGELATQGGRRSPVEFAVSMGALYSRAGATGAPLEAAWRRLSRVLSTAAGVPPTLLTAGPAAIRRSLDERFGEQEAWAVLERDIARALGDGDRQLPAQEALAIVRALDRHATELPEQVRRVRTGG